jgi:hypothetical protein
MQQGRGNGDGDPEEREKIKIKIERNYLEHLGSRGWVRRNLLRYFVFQLYMRLSVWHVLYRWLYKF